MSLIYKQSREAMEHVLTNVFELKRKYLNQKTLNHNGYECIENFVNISDTDTQNLRCKISTKKLKYLSIGHQNLIMSFIDYFKYRTYDNYVI